MTTLTPATERAARVVWDPLRDAGRERARHAAAARRRGLIQSAVGFAAAAILAWRFGAVPAAVAAAIAATLGGLALASPLGGLRRVEGAVGRFAAAVGTAVAWVLLAPLYWLLLTPLGWLLRARGRLRIRRRPDARVATYWTELPEPAPGAAPYERQF